MVRDNKGRFMDGHVTWLGKKLSEEHKQKLSEAHKGKPVWANGRKFSEEHKENISKSKQGKGLSQQHKEAISRANKKPNSGQFKKGKVYSETDRQKLRLAAGRRTSSMIKAMLRRKQKSTLEVKFEELIKLLGLPYSFVGNGDFIIAKKCPDFIASNGKKIAVEVYYKKHKQQFRNGIDEWKAERTRIFNEEGWEIVFFDETEVNEACVMQKLQKTNELNKIRESE